MTRTIPAAASRLGATPTVSFEDDPEIGALPETPAPSRAAHRSIFAGYPTAPFKGITPEPGTAYFSHSPARFRWQRRINLEPGALEAGR